MNEAVKIKVYAGLSVSKEEVVSILPQAEVARPVKRGDTLFDIRHGINVIAIIDGRFQDVLAVSSTELMDCMRCGIRVYGSSSMGALRAAELSPYGMIGVGDIYEYIRNTPYFRDDLLGQRLSGDMTDAGCPYVNFMFGLKWLQETGEIDVETQTLLDQAYRDLHFGERDRFGLRDNLRSLHPESSDELMAVANRVFTEHNQKKSDAIKLLQQIKEDLTEVSRLNLQLAEAAKQIPVIEGLYPSEEEYERELTESRERLRASRAEVLRSFLGSAPAAASEEASKTESSE